MSEATTERVAAFVKQSGVEEGMVLVSAMHITAGVFVNDHEPGLWKDIWAWLEHLAPERPEALLGHVSLLLDLGRPADATTLLLAERSAWLAADPSDRTALIARHRDALRLFAPSMILSADPVGALAHEP